MLEGVGDGLVAFVAKIHHSVADGTASSELLRNVMISLETKPLRNTPSLSIPSKTNLLIEALREQRTRLSKLPALLRRTVGQGLIAMKNLRENAHITRPFAGPKTRFNGASTKDRIFATEDIRFEQLQRVKDNLGVTVNDLVLCLAGEALRRFLEEQKEPLAESLIASVPTAERENRLYGNRLSNIFISLCTDIPNLRDRCREIHRRAHAAKEIHAEFGADLMTEWAEYAPPLPFKWGARAYSRLNIADGHSSAANLIISNVRGPASELLVSGTKLKRFYSVGPTMEGIGLNITAWSYNGYMTFTALSSRGSDLHSLLQFIPEILCELDDEPKQQKIVSPRISSPRLSALSA